MNKRGEYVTSWGVTIISIIGLVVVGLIMLYMTDAFIQEKKDINLQDIEISEASFATRILLNTQIKEGYKVYDLVIDAVNSGQEEKIEPILLNILNDKYNRPKGEEWIFVINGKDYTTKNRGQVSNVVNSVPPVIIPNPYGRNIEIIFKPLRPIDYKNVERLFYGYEAGDFQRTANSGMTGELAAIKDIPRITCTATNCFASEELVEQLKVVSEKELKPRGMTAVVVSGYRDWYHQKELYDAFQAGRGNIACNPGSATNQNECPHMIAGAVDIYFYDSNGKVINHPDKPEKMNQALADEIMCNQGFVRWVQENWHYEYGSISWRRVQETNSQGVRKCTFG